jgi:VWFA-related protein
MMGTVVRISDSAANEAGDTLSEIAASTGGTAFQNSNDLLTGLQCAFADGRQYYLLAYVPLNSNQDGKFRAISVRLRDGKMLVKAKRGYWSVAK